MATEEKKRIQAYLDKETSIKVEYILENLGLNQSTLISMLYNRVVATGKIPFELTLTEQEKAELGLYDKVKQLPKDGG